MVIAIMLALTQFFLSSYICWAVQTNQPDAGLGAIFYFYFIGYLPWGHVVAKLFPNTPNLLPIINFQSQSIWRFLPSVATATINWFLWGLLIGNIIEAMLRDGLKKSKK